jgi:hypothetical protein
MVKRKSLGLATRFIACVGIIASMSACGVDTDSTSSGFSGAWTIPVEAWRPYDDGAIYEYFAYDGYYQSSELITSKGDENCDVRFTGSVGRAVCLHEAIYRENYYEFYTGAERSFDVQFNNSLDATIRISEKQISVEGVRAVRYSGNGYSDLCEQKFYGSAERLEGRASDGRFEMFAGNWRGETTMIETCDSNPADVRSSSRSFSADVFGENASITLDRTATALTSRWSAENSGFGILVRELGGDSSHLVAESN